MTGSAPERLLALRDALRVFAIEREWERFHTVKDLTVALSVEAGELLEHALWCAPAELETRLSEDPVAREAFADEIGDVLLTLIRLSDRAGISPVAAAEAKLAKNRRKYPVDQARGRSEKYTAYSSDKPPD